MGKQQPLAANRIFPDAPDIESETQTRRARMRHWLKSHGVDGYKLIFESRGLLPYPITRTFCKSNLKIQEPYVDCEHFSLRHSDYTLLRTCTIGM